MKTKSKTIPQLKQGEMYCYPCNKVIKKPNFYRHDNSEYHNKNVKRFVDREIKQLEIK